MKFQYWLVACCFLFVVNLGYAEARYSIHCQAVPLSALFQLAAQLKQINLVVQGDLKTSASVQLENVSLDDIITRLVSEYQLHLEKQSTLWRIYTQAFWQQQTKERLLNSTIETLYWPVKYADAKSLRMLIKAQPDLLSKQGSIVVDTRTNTLVIRDHLVKLTGIKAVLKHLDIPVKQVLIQAKIAIMDARALRELGVKLATTSTTTEGKSGINEAALHLGIANPAAVLGLAFGRLPSGEQLNLELQALQSRGQGKVISSPRLVVANKQEAYIEQGDEVPFNTSTSSGATQVEFKKAVLGLYVTPQITPDGSVLMQLKVSKDFVTRDKGAAGDIPIIATSVMQTQVLVKDHQTLVLGGILNQEDRHDIKQVPWLGNLPLIGWLFKNAADQNSRAELVIFVTPTILTDSVQSKLSPSSAAKESSGKLQSSSG